VNSDHFKAISNYELALTYVRSLPDTFLCEGLILELHAKFWITLSNLRFASACLREARLAYAKWGSQRKVYMMDSQYQSLLPPEAIPTVIPGIISPSPTSSRNNIWPQTPRNSASPATSVPATPTAATMDVSTVLKATQSISTETRLDTLLDRLMEHVQVNAGATSIYLVLHEQGQLLIQASRHVRQDGEDDVQLLQGLPADPSTFSNKTDRVKSNLNQVSLEDNSNNNNNNNNKMIPLLPLSILYYVFRSRDSIVLADAASEGQFTQDLYVLKHRPKSVLCTPIMNKGSVIGLVYLENNILYRAFTPDRLEVIKSLAASASIVIENAKLSKVRILKKIRLSIL